MEKRYKTRYVLTGSDRDRSERVGPLVWANDVLSALGQIDQVLHRDGLDDPKWSYRVTAVEEIPTFPRD